VHAKIAVTDEEFCFISGTNLTGHAMERNMEAGVLIKGGAIPPHASQAPRSACQDERDCKGTDLKRSSGVMSCVDNSGMRLDAPV
jgi:phosphatidylserine/phosphatidylglycerophosphate/cardiolipin synthase-like enzyme